MSDYPNRHTMAVQPTWNNDDDLLKLIQEEEAQEKLKAKTTDSIPKKGQNVVIDDKPIFVNSRISQWEKSIQERNDDVKRTKAMFGTATGPAQPVAPSTVNVPKPTESPNPWKKSTQPVEPPKPTQTLPAEHPFIKPAVVPKPQEPPHPVEIKKVESIVETSPPVVEPVPIVVPKAPQQLSPAKQQVAQPKPTESEPPKPVEKAEINSEPITAKKALNRWEQAIQRQQAQKREEEQRRKKQFQSVATHAAKQLHETVPSSDNSIRAAQSAYQSVKPVESNYHSVRPVQSNYQSVRPAESAYQSVKPVESNYQSVKPVVSQPPTQNTTVISPKKEDQPAKPEEPAPSQGTPMKMADRLKMFQQAASKVSANTVHTSPKPVVVEQSTPPAVIKVAPVAAQPVWVKEQSQQQAKKQEVLAPLQPQTIIAPPVVQHPVVEQLPASKIEPVSKVEPHQPVVQTPVVQQPTPQPVLAKKEQIPIPQPIVTVKPEPKEEPAVDDPKMTKIKQSIDDKKVSASNLKNMWQTVLKKQNTEAAQSRQSWNQLITKVKEAHVDTKPEAVKQPTKPIEQVDDIMNQFMEEDRAKQQAPPAKSQEVVEQVKEEGAVHHAEDTVQQPVVVEVAKQEPIPEEKVMEIEADIEYETADHKIVHKHKHYEVTVDKQHHTHLVECAEEQKQAVPDIPVIHEHQNEKPIQEEAPPAVQPQPEAAVVPEKVDVKPQEVEPVVIVAEPPLEIVQLSHTPAPEKPAESVQPVPTVHVQPVEIAVSEQAVAVEQVSEASEQVGQQAPEPEESVSIVKKFGDMLSKNLAGRVPGAPMPVAEPAAETAEQPAELTACHPEGPTTELLQAHKKKKKQLPTFSEI